MDVDFQSVLNLITYIGALSFPIAMVFCVTEKLIDMALDFISGRRVKL